MDFAFSAEQEFLRRTARDWLAARAPMGVVRRLVDDPVGHDPALWAEIAELGWQAMAIPEHLGGAGFGFLEQAVLLEEMGRSLFPSPYLGTVILAANALLAGADDAQQQRWLPGIAAGEVLATVALPDAAVVTDDTPLGVTARADGGGWVLDGECRFVIDGAVVDIVIVPAHTSDGPGLFVVDAAEVTVEAPVTLDPTRRLGHLRFDGAPAVDRLAGGSATDVLTRVIRIGAVAIALEAVGGAERALDMSVQYAKDRVQFGRPIGSFQAIKHLCADMLVAVESARAAAHYAAWVVAEDNDELPHVSPLAKAYCTEAFFRCAADSIQIHGGIGFTWEHDAHFYLKRAKSSEVLLGDAAAHRHAVADLLEI